MTRKRSKPFMWRHGMDKLVIPVSDKQQLEVYSHLGSFYKGIAALRQEGLELITARELAEARILLGDYNHQMNRFTWVAEHPVYLVDKQADVLVVDRAHSQLLGHPVEMMPTDPDLSNWFSVQFSIDQKVVDELRGIATLDGEHGVLLLSRKAVRRAVPVEALADNAYTRFLFRDMAGPYGQFLKEAGIKKVPVYICFAVYVRKKQQPFGLAFVVDDLFEGRSGLGGGQSPYLFDYPVHGIRCVSLK